MIDTRAAALAEMVAATEAVLATCERGEGTASALSELAAQRDALIARFPAGGTVDAAERKLAARLRELDLHVLGFARAMQDEILAAHGRVQQQHASHDRTATVLARRMLDEVA
ncbi:MAG: hypothetical protein K1X88_11135 [Nannocystaceae bacterium]|nr:hypothetical protein [Nannocystaceae bacterium]